MAKKKIKSKARKSKSKAKAKKKVGKVKLGHARKAKHAKMKAKAGGKARRAKAAVRATGHAESRPSVEMMLPKPVQTAPVVVVPKATAIPPAQVDRVHLQNIGYEIASMKRMLERMLTQLEKLEDGLSERREEAEA